MSNGNGFAKFPLMNQQKGRKKSQVEEYLDFYEGEGVQHIAVATKDIIKTVTELKARSRIPFSTTRSLLRNGSRKSGNNRRRH